MLADSTTPLALKAKAVHMEMVYMRHYFSVRSQGIGAGTISDVYRYSTYSQFAWTLWGVWDSPLPNMRLIQMTPGVTFGAGAQVMY